MTAVVSKPHQVEVKPITAVKIGPCSLYCACIPRSSDSLNANELVVSDKFKLLRKGATDEDSREAADAGQFAKEPDNVLASEPQKQHPTPTNIDVGIAAAAAAGDALAAEQLAGHVLAQVARRRNQVEEVAKDMATGRAAQVEALCEFIGVALRAGRALEARRALVALESLGLSNLVSDKDIAKVKLVSGECEASLQNELMSIESLERAAQESGTSDWVFERFEEQQGLEAVAYRYAEEDGTLYIVCEARCPDLDAIKAFANVVEYDLTASVQNVIGAEVVSASHGPVEALWHAYKSVSKPRVPELPDPKPAAVAVSGGGCSSFQQLGAALRRLCGSPRAAAVSSTTPTAPPLKRNLTTHREFREDNVMRIMAVDALDIQAGQHGLWAAIYALGDDVHEVDGVPLPAVKEGHIRNPRRRSAWHFKPLRDSRGKICQGCDLTVFFALNPFDQALMSKTAANIAHFLTGFEASVASSKDLEDRMTNSPRQAFYSQVSRHVEGRSDIHLPQVAELPLLNQSGSPAGNPAEAGFKRRTSLLSRGLVSEQTRTTPAGAFEDVSSTIPAGWANA
mmetsp:Transcript_14192/g.32164  ORF Transcript_14192/g.32164 Transcript_14192/m.32164 type:complete len:568 (-) Transcript_14192:9-1712(-)